MAGGDPRSPPASREPSPAPPNPRKSRLPRCVSVKNNPDKKTIEVKLINFLLPGSRSRVAACLLVIAFSANAQQGRQDFSKVEIKIIAFGPGHTDGDAAVYFTNSKVLHLGDQFVTGRFPYVDVANEWW